MQDLKKDQQSTLFKIGTDLKYSQKAPVGEYDTEILCGKCDKKLGVFDKYFIELSRSNFNLTRKEWEGHEYFICEEYNHKLFYQFFISLLWRASISKRDMFKNIKLGSYENLFEEYILNELGNPNFGNIEIIMGKYPNFKDGLKNTHIDTKRIEGLDCYCFYYDHYEFLVKVDEKLFKEPLKTFCIRNNQFYVFSLDSEKKMDSLRKQLKL